MNKFQALYEFILGLELFAAENLDAWVDDLTVTPAMWSLEVDKIVIAEKSYTAMFSIERFPDKNVGRDLLLAQVSAWLIANDGPNDGNMELKVIVDDNDSDSSNIDFGIVFKEQIVAKKTPGGPIVVKGVEYALQ